MNGQWILGRDGSEKILAVGEKFFQNRREYWSNRYPSLHLPAYEPWMSKKGLGEEVISAGVLYEPGKRPFVSQEYIDKASSLYRDSLALSSFKNSANKPFSRLYLVYPECYSLHENAYQFLAGSDSWLSDLTKKLVLEFLPIGLDDGPYNGLGGISDPALVGTIFMGLISQPFQRIRTTIALAHEIGHQALMLFQTIDNISGGHRDKLVYSGVRDTERPLLHSLHAAVAIAYMIEGGRLLLDVGDLTLDEIGYLEELQKEHISGLAKGTAALQEFELSPVGSRILDDLVNFVASAGTKID